MHIHILSNSLRMNSGFSIVAKNIAIGLKKLGHQVTFTGMQTAYNSEWVDSIEVLPIQVNYVDDMTQYIMTLDRIKPDIVLAIFQMDMGTNNPFARVFPKTIIYCPVEGRNIPQGMSNDLLQIKMDGGFVVAQCQYGRSEMKLALGGLEIPYIYHGYNPGIFGPMNLGNIDNIRYCYYKTDDGQTNSDPLSLHSMGCYDCKLSNKEQSSCPYYKDEQVSILRFVNGKWTEERIKITDLPIVTKNIYVFGSVGQNVGVRKRIERLLRAYSIFIKGSKQLKDRTVLHLHTRPIAIDGINLIKVIQDLGLQDNILFSYGTHRSSGWTEQAINILYNTFDVNVSASSSEGFCLPVLEGMSCGIPMVAPNCSSFTELIGNEKDKNRRGLLASIGEWQMIQDSSYRALVSEENLAHQMKEMYQNKDLYKLCSKNAIEWSKQYTWQNICKQWDDLLKAMK